MLPRLRQKCTFVYLIVSLCLSWLLAACGGAATAPQPDKSTDTQSSAFATDAEKTAFLQQYLKLPTPVEATEFHVVYHDNSQGIPGPSDWDIRAALKVAPSDLPRWTDGLQPMDAATADLAWAAGLLPDAPRWAHSSPPEVYRRSESNAIVVVYAPEGIVLKRVWTQ